MSLLHKPLCYMVTLLFVAEVIPDTNSLKFIPQYPKFLINNISEITPVQSII